MRWQGSDCDDAEAGAGGIYGAGARAGGIGGAGELGTAAESVAELTKAGFGEPKRKCVRPRRLHAAPPSAGTGLSSAFSTCVRLAICVTITALTSQRVWRPAWRCRQRPGAKGPHLSGHSEQGSMLVVVHADADAPRCDQLLPNAPAEKRTGGDYIPFYFNALQGGLNVWYALAAEPSWQCRCGSCSN